MNMHRLHPSFFALLLLSLTATTGAAQTREPLPVPDIPGYTTLKCDFHMHTVFSDGEVWPPTRVREAWRDGLDAISITDHSNYNPHSEDVKNDPSRAYELALPLAKILGMILIPGIEVGEGDIHCNALFIKGSGSLRGAKLLETLQEARNQDAFVFWNHPGWKQTAEWFPLVADAHDQRLIQGIELVNGPSFYPEAFPWVEERKLTVLADSDTHEPMAPARPGQVRPITLVFAKTSDETGIREALFARRTAAWMGGEVWGDESLLKMLWEGAVKAESIESNLKPGGPPVGVRLRNHSAIPFHLRMGKGPEWLLGARADVLLPGQREIVGGFRAAENAPLGTQEIEIDLEITNFHVAPGKNLTVRLPLSLVLHE
jgi:hypothetical protein